MQTISIFDSIAAIKDYPNLRDLIRMDPDGIDIVATPMSWIASSDSSHATIRLIVRDIIPLAGASYQPANQLVCQHLHYRVAGPAF